MPPIACAIRPIFTDREIPAGLCVSPLLLVACRCSACQGSSFILINRICSIPVTLPPLSPRVVATSGQAGHRVWLVVARCRQATATCSGIRGVRGRGPTLPTSRPAHHSSSLTAGETQPTSKAHHQPQAPEPTGRSLLSSEWPAPACGAVWPLYNPLRPAESSWAVRAAGPCHNPPVCGCPLRPRTAHNGGHGHEAAAGPPQPTATPPLWRAEQRAAASGEPATAHRSAAAEECAALQPPRRSAEVEQQ